MSRPADISALLAALPLFRAVPGTAMVDLVRASHEVRLDKGCIVFNRGDQPSGFYVVVYGQVKLAIPGPIGIEKVVELIGPGSSFGEAVLFLDKPYLVCAQALVDSLLIHVGKTALFRLLDQNPLFARQMLAGLSMRLHGLVQDVAGYAMLSGMQRLIGYLLPRIQGQPPVVKLPASKHVVASRLNLTPETFSRILHELTSAGLIAVHARDIEIRDEAGLRNFGFPADNS